MVCYGLRNEQICQMFVRRFFIRDFHNIYIYLAKDYIYSYEGYLCLVKDFLGTQRLFSVRIFSRTFFEFGRRQFGTVFTLFVFFTNIRFIL